LRLCWVLSRLVWEEAGSGGIKEQSYYSRGQAGIKKNRLDAIYGKVQNMLRDNAEWRIPMKTNKHSRVKKIVMILGICVIVLTIMYYFLTINRGEGDPVIIFHEVPVNETINCSVTYLTDKDILNKQGWEIIKNNGKITRIYFRDPYTAESNFFSFLEKYGGFSGNFTSKKYIEYNGVYYYISGLRP